jgi:hypothetical protein
VSAYLADRLGLKLFEDSEGLNRAVRILETRNLIVHNWAVVNRLLLSRIPGYPASEGQRLEFQVDPIFDDAEFLAHCVADIDPRAAEKFGLPTPINRETNSTRE